MNTRNNWWDWLKLLAVGAMFVDHLRFLTPVLSGVLVPGRISMPLFAVIAGANFRASVNKEGYIRRLVPFALVSEVPFWFLTGGAGNVLMLFTLVFGFVLTSNCFVAIAASSCAYSGGGLAALLMAVIGTSRPFLFAAGVALNPFPLGIISGAAAMLPTCEIDMPPCTLVRGDFLLWFYFVHLVVLAGAKVMFFN